MKTIQVLLFLLCASAGCQNGATPSTCTGAACTSACTGAACTSANRGVGLKWQILSLARNAGGRIASSSGAPGDSPIPALRSNSIRQSLALGLNHTCALANTGAHDGHVLCWGDDRAGQIGNGTTAASPVFDPAEVLGLPGGDFPLQIAAGDAHTCALVASGRIFCWGSNSHGQLGVDAALFPNSPAATPVTGAEGRIFSQVAAGGDQTCALDSESHAFCWGNNASGQLGTGTTVDSSVPMLVMVDGKPMPFGHITTSANHTCAAEGPEGGFHWGSVYCWGDDSHGQLANTSHALPLSAGSRIFPAPVLALDNTGGPSGLDGLQLIQRVSSGVQHTCGITIYGNYYCWGDNSQNQLGVIDPASAFGPNARLDFSNYPAMYSSLSFGDPPGGTGQITFTAGPVSYTSGSVTPASPQMVSGSNHVCSLSIGGSPPSAYCWGSNRSGQLGPASPPLTSPTAVPVSPGPAGVEFNELAAGGDHTCGVASDGNVYCWGDNADGQLGRGQGPSTPVPQAVGRYFPDVSGTIVAPPPIAKAPLVDCKINPNVGDAPNNGNLSSYLFYAEDVFKGTTHVTEVDLKLQSDSTTFASEFGLALYSYSAGSNTYTKLGETRARRIFAALAAPSDFARFVFDAPGVLVTVPAGQSAQPVVLQFRQRSGITFNMWANAIVNAGSDACPIDKNEAYTSIPIQIYSE